MVSRADRSEFAEWWWTVDKLLLAGVFALMIGGVVLSLAGSPAVAERLGYDSFHFVNRHIAFFLPALAVMIATSFLTPRQARRAALIVLCISLVLMLARRSSSASRTTARGAGSTSSACRSSLRSS